MKKKFLLRVKKMLKKKKHLIKQIKKKAMKKYIN